MKVSLTQAHRLVSIPQAGFCRFTLTQPGTQPGPQPGFQSLRRDSVGSHVRGLNERSITIKVSIPQAGFCRFTLA